MRQFVSVLVLTLSLATPVAPAIARAEDMAQETAEHPRIAKAIHALEDAIRYMEGAPHDFGGHKAEAIHASHKAVEQLRLALRYRASHDKK